MRLNSYVAERRRRLFDDLRAGRAPSEGLYDELALREARSKGEPQLGTTRLSPHAIELEFIYPDPRGASSVITVRLDPPERIVFMPVPEWVVESIWQGEIAGSHHFESDAYAMVDVFREGLAEATNAARFERQEPTRRE
ncbi:MAG: hypothetical protein ACO1SV_18170 [Fimbriimonas sp.]